ncbi:MAG: CHRD domain-containing protein [Nitrososphaeraceae archaeon]
MSQKHTLLVVVVLTAVLSVGAFSTTLNFLKVQAQEGEKFSALLSGQQEVPVTNSTANGTANFVLHSNGTELSYDVNLKGLKVVDTLDISANRTGLEGRDIVHLVGKREAENQSSPAAAEVTIRGNITNDDLKGPLKGMNVSDLAKFLQNGSAYIEADTPKFPAGAIRGQIASGSEMSMGSTVATPEGGNTTSMGESPASTSEENDNSMATSADNSTTMMGNSTNSTS